MEEEEGAKANEPEVPNLKEIMDMEMALATCRNDFVSNSSLMNFSRNFFKVKNNFLC